MKNFLMGVFKVCLDKSPGVKICPAHGVMDFPYMCTSFGTVVFPQQ
jgi:hypothetical protein